MEYCTKFTSRLNVFATLKLIKRFNGCNLRSITELPELKDCWPDLEELVLNGNIGLVKFRLLI